MDKDFNLFLSTIVNEYNPEKVILFGSRAWGQVREDSDYDLLVVMESDEPKAVNRSIDILTKFNTKLLPLDLIARTPKEIAAKTAVGDSFLTNILKKGKTLYERRS